MRRLLAGMVVVLVVVFSHGPQSWAAGAKNVILMIGDGMGPAHVHTTWLYATRQLGKKFAMTDLMNEGRVSYVRNDTQESTVTESAEAATQMATGSKAFAKAISVGRDGKSLKTILEWAREAGKASGLVTTSGITDATPAAFAAHVDDRWKEETIAEQLIGSGVEILFGGRKGFFLPEGEKGGRKDGRNLLQEARRNGYTVAETSEEMKKAEGGKILGLFNLGNMLYEIDRKGSQEPSLAEMTAKSLAVLEKDPDGFFLMVEAGRIDHASHRNDIATVVSDTLAFDEAIQAADRFRKEHPDTLLMITADHETGGLVILPYDHTSKEFVGVNLDAISRIKGSHEARSRELGKDPTPEKIREVVKKYYDVDLKENELKGIVENGIGRLDPRHFRDIDGSIAFALRLYHRIGWNLETHTATPLPLVGVGPGSEKIKGWMHNTELFVIMKEAYGF
jgi:alkaline phosphatase